MPQVRRNSRVLCDVSLVSCSLLLLFSVQLASATNLGVSADEKAYCKSVHDLIRGDKWQKCYELSNEYLAKHKNSLLAVSIRGCAMMETNREASALRDFNRAIAAGYEKIPVLVTEHHPNSVLAMRGFTNLQTGKLKEGIADIEKSIKEEPQTVSEFLNQRFDFRNLGTAYRKLGEVSKAAYYFRAAEIREKQMAFVFEPDLVKPADLARETEATRQALKKSPKNNVKLLRMAVNLYAGKKYPEALKYVDKVIENEPYLTRAMLLRYDILKGMNRAGEADGDLEKVLRYVERPSSNAFSAGDKVVLSARLIEICKESNNVDGQIRVLKSIADAGTAGESQLFDLGECYAAKKQWAKAVESYDEALQYAVDNKPLIYSARAKAQKMLGHLKESQADEKRASDRGTK